MPCTLAAGVVVAELDLQPSLLHGATFPPGKEKLLSDLIPVLSGLVEALTMSPCAVIFLPFFLLPFFFLSFFFISFAFSRAAPVTYGGSFPHCSMRKLQLIPFLVPSDLNPVLTEH